MPSTRQRPRTAGLGAAAALGLLGAACGDRIELDGIVVIPEFSAPICGGTFPMMERRLDWLVAVTGAPRADRPIRFYWSPYGGERCDTGGCTNRRGRIHGDLLAFSHELVHAHLNRFEEQRPWLNEGMATILDDNLSGGPTWFSLPSNLLNAELDHLHYEGAANFVLFLREQYGMDKLMRFYALSEDTDLDEAKAAFRTAFGESFEDVADRYVRPYIVRRLGSLDCDLPELDHDGHEWRRTFHGSCDDADSVGPYFGLQPGDPAYLTNAAVFETTEAHPLELVAEAEHEVHVTVTSCDLSFQLSQSGTSLAMPLELTPGHHRVVVQVKLDEPQDIDVIVRPVSAAAP